MDEIDTCVMSATRGEMLTPNPNECNSALKSGTSEGTAPTYTIYTTPTYTTYTRGGGQLPNPKSAILR